MNTTQEKETITPTTETITPTTTEVEETAAATLPSSSTAATTTSSSPPIDAIPHYKQILIPHDGSKKSDKALGHAIYLSKISDADIVILNVLEHLEGSVPSSVSATLKEEDERPGVKGLDKGDRDLEITMEGGVKKMIEDRINLCKEAGVKSQISYKLQTGKPVDEIVKLCKEMDIDLIVMASSRITSTFAVMGSTTRKVIDNTKKPVLVIHE